MHIAKQYVYLSILLVFLSWKSSAQLNISHEIGVLAGPAGFFTDYGERYNLQNNVSNEGLGIGLVHFMNFAFKKECNCKSNDGWFSRYFRIRNEIDYLRSNLDHFGPVAEKDNEAGRQLRAMHGFTETFEAGTHLEYHPMGIRDFTNFAVLFAPYIGLGVHYVHYRPDAFSELGELDNPKVLFPTFQGGLNLEPGNTFAIVGYGGVRYRLGRSSDLLIEGRAQYYDTDLLEGLVTQGPQNKFNDFVLWLSLGYVYYLDF